MRLNSMLEIQFSDNGKQIKHHSGSQFVVLLPENPMAGYEWELNEYDQAIVQPRLSDFELSATGAVGAGGMRRFKFESVSTGSTELSFKYHRNFESGPPAATFSVIIHVS